MLGTGGDNSQLRRRLVLRGRDDGGLPVRRRRRGRAGQHRRGGLRRHHQPRRDSAAAASAAGRRWSIGRGTGAGASGFSSVYTVDSANGHLQETYLPYMGDSWTTQDLSGPAAPCRHPAGDARHAAGGAGALRVYQRLHGRRVAAATCRRPTCRPSATRGPPRTCRRSTAPRRRTRRRPPWCTPPGQRARRPAAATPACTPSTGTGTCRRPTCPTRGSPATRGSPRTCRDRRHTAGTPAGPAGTSPVAIVHCGFTSVYTVDAGNHHLQETYLPAIGDSWSTQDLSRELRHPDRPPRPRPP